MISRLLNQKDIRNLPLMQWTGAVKVFSTKKQMRAATEKLLQEKVVGFDMEYGRNREPALVQFATTHIVYLYRVLNSHDHVNTLEPLLKSHKVTKAGVNVNGDLKFLSPFNVASNNFFEVPDVTKPIGYSARGLKLLCADVLGVRITKSKPKSKSWMDPWLSPGQIKYAATDAYAALRLYLAAKKK